MHAWVYGVMIAIVVVLSMIYLAGLPRVEHFTTVDLDTATAQRQQLQFEGERRYNNFARLQNPRVTLDADQVDAALQQEIPVPTASSKSLMSLLGFVGLGSAAPPSGATGVEQTGAVQQKIDFCESLKTVNCDLLSDPRLAECGFCHRDGTNSKGRPHRGGLYISSDDQIRANEVSLANNNAPATYKPTIGACKPQNFTLMNESCQIRELQMTCQTGGGPTSGNPCGQCFGSAKSGATGLLYMGPKPQSYTATLWVSHPGAHSSGGAGLAVRYSNGYTVTLPPSNQTLLDPQSLTLTLTEGDQLQIAVAGVPAVWCGWLSNADGTRTVSLDIGNQGIVPAAGFTVAGDKRSGVVTTAMSAADPNAWNRFQANVPNSVLWFKRNDEVVPGAVVSAWYGVSPASQGNTQGTDVTAYVKLAAGGNIPVDISPEVFQIPDPAPNVPKHLWITQDNGQSQIGVDYQVLAASLFYNAMIMNFTVPATLANPLFSDDVADCPTGPIVMTEVGAGLMGAHSCFKVDGSFNPNLYCIQELWTAAGGTPQGRLYPKTDKDAAILALNDPTTHKPSLDATVAAFNNSVNIAMYGVDINGAPQDFQRIKDNALDFLGVVMNNPCDGTTASTGPHTPECLDYLWRTSGDASQDGSTVDPTKLPYAYCKDGGGAAPLNKDGTVNQANVTIANNLGGIPNVRAYYQSIFNRTQDNSDFDSQAAAMRDCFNVNIKQPKEASAGCPAPNPDEWQCFGPDKMAQPEVFFVTGDIKAQAGAATVCSTYGAQLATTAQVATAQQQGGSWCGAGWVSDSDTVAAPYTGCAKGVAGANCFGKKPATGTLDVLPFNGSAWRNPASMPSGWSNDKVIIAKEISQNNIMCGGPTTATCFGFTSDQQCQDFLANNTAPILPANADPNMAGTINQYLRARV